jgi:hypothetical protein
VEPPQFWWFRSGSLDHERAPCEAVSVPEHELHSLDRLEKICVAEKIEANGDDEAIDKAHGLNRNAQECEDLERQGSGRDAGGSRSR